MKRNHHQKMCTKLLNDELSILKMVNLYRLSEVLLYEPLHRSSRRIGTYDDYVSVYVTFLCTVNYNPLIAI